MNGSRLQTLRSLYRSRSEAPRASERGLAVYVALLLVVIVVVPIARLVVLYVTGSGSSIVHAEAFGMVVSVSVGILLAASVPLGAIRGPVAMTGFRLLLMAETDLPRHRGLGGSFAKSLLLAVGSFLGAGCVVALAAGSSSAQGIGDHLFVLSYFLCMAVTSSVLWLLGQGLRPASRYAVSLGIAVLTAGGLLIESARLFTPWWWIDAFWGDPGTEDGLGQAAAWPTIVLLVVSVSALCVTPRLLRQLSLWDLHAQARTWSQFGAAASVGELSIAVQGFRVMPMVGRSLTALRGSGFAAMTVWSSLIALCRSPGRLVCGVIFLSGGAVAMAWSLTHGGVFAIVGGALGSVIAFLAIGVFCDGFRWSAHAKASFPLFGVGIGRLYLVHALFPIAAVAVVYVPVALVLGTGHAFDSRLVLVGAELLFLVVVRAYDSARGDFPFHLLTPVPSPVGDPSVLMLILWNMDALIMAAGSGFFIALSSTTGAVMPVALGLGLAGIAVGYLLVRRLGQL